MDDRQTRMSPVLKVYRASLSLWLRPGPTLFRSLSLSLGLTDSLARSFARQMGTGLGTLDQVPRAKRRRRCRLRAWSLGTRASRVENGDTHHILPVWGRDVGEVYSCALSNRR